MKLTYLVKYKNSNGKVREAEIDIAFTNVKDSMKVNILDEIARRYLIEEMFRKGNVVSKIRLLK